jgi:primosomal protein N' (replication factor Y)
MADVGFNVPDFRASERSFQLLTQVSGRAGRHGQHSGRVIIQTYNPEHSSILFTQQHDYLGFATQELRHRAELFYPPYGRLLGLRILGASHSLVQKASDQIATRAQSLKSAFASFDRIQILGPAPAPLARLRGQYRYHCLLKGPTAKELNEFCQRLMADSKSWAIPRTKVQIDVDPIQML